MRRRELGKHLDRTPYKLAFMCLLFFSVTPKTWPQNYTVGDKLGDDHTAFLFAPYRWDNIEFADWAYEAHLTYYPPEEGETAGGQRYEYFEYVDANPPGLVPGNCTVARFTELIHDKTSQLGTLLISTHGSDNNISIEVYDSGAAGYAAMLQYWHTYVDTDFAGPDTGFSPWEVITCSTGGSGYPIYHCIAVTADFIRAFGNLNQSLVYVNSCEGYTLTDDFVAANARVSVGHKDHPLFYPLVYRLLWFFWRMDGKEGLENRPFSAARASPPNIMDGLGAHGEENTVLAPGVEGIYADIPLHVGSAVFVHLDTPCDMYWQPQIECDQCSVRFVQWVDSTYFQAEYTWPPPLGVNECQFRLKFYDIESARNASYLDGNTDPEGGGNAEGPAHDDYVWTMAVASCDCGYWGDVSADSSINPVDVVYMVNCVYLGIDLRVQHANCPREAGDANCDGLINPQDVVLYINRVYLGIDGFCPDPCS